MTRSHKTIKLALRYLNAAKEELERKVTRPQHALNVINNGLDVFKILDDKESVIESVFRGYDDN